MNLAQSVRSHASRHMTRFQSWVCEPCRQCPSLVGTHVVSPDWRFWAIESHLFIFRRYSPSVSPSGLFPLTLLTTRHEGHVAPCLRQHFVLLICFFFFWSHCTAWRIIVPSPGSELVPPALEARSPNHWTITEVSHASFSLQLLLDVQ